MSATPVNIFALDRPRSTLRTTGVASQNANTQFERDSLSLDCSHPVLPEQKTYKSMNYSIYLYLKLYQMRNTQVQAERPIYMKKQKSCMISAPPPRDPMGRN
jgi:hypothetical protein